MFKAGWKNLGTPRAVGLVGLLATTPAIDLAPTGAQADNIMSCNQIEQACITHANNMAQQESLLIGVNANPVDPNLIDPGYCMDLYNTAEQSGVWPETSYFTPSTPCSP